MKIANFLFILLFLTAAFLQLNDPDPFLWFGIYFSGALICGLAITHQLHQSLLWVGLTFYTIYCIYLFRSPDGVLSWYVNHEAENIAQSMKAEKPWIEAAREFFGLLILISAASLNLLFYKRTSTKSEIIRK